MQALHNSEAGPAYFLFLNFFAKIFQQFLKVRNGWTVASSSVACTINT